jgi:hypothetical protein
MSDLDSLDDEPEHHHDDGGSVRRTLWKQAPYIAALILAISGVAYSNISHQPLIGYWEFLAIAMGLMCIVTQWEYADDRNARFRLVITQVLHWAAVLVTMNIMVMFRVRSLIPDQSLSLVLLALLALGTFLAGINFLSLPIGFLGLAMVLTVPAIAWLTQSFLFLLLIVVLLIGLGVALWPARGGRRTRVHDD